jgi:hypothetical protein
MKKDPRKAFRRLRRRTASVAVLGLGSLFLSGCATNTNYNDVMAAFVRSQAETQIEVARINAQAKITAAQYGAEEAIALANAPLGGMTIRDPESGFETTYTNPNPRLYGATSPTSVALNTQNSPQPKPVILPQKPPSTVEKVASGGLKLVGALINPAATVWAAKYTTDAQVAMRQSDNERWIAESTNQLLTQQSMFNTFSGYGDNMTTVATTATGDMASVANTSVEQATALGLGVSSDNTDMMTSLGENFRDVAIDNSRVHGAVAISFSEQYTQMMEYWAQYFQNNETTNTSSSSSNSSSQTIPDWVADAIVVPVP